MDKHTSPVTSGAKTSIVSCLTCENVSTDDGGSNSLCRLVAGTALNYTIAFGYQVVYSSQSCGTETLGRYGLTALEALRKKSLKVRLLIRKAECYMSARGVTVTSKVIAALKGGALVFDLSQPLENGMPCSPSHPGFRMALLRRHEDTVTDNASFTGANEIIVTGGHVGTHLDALCHVAVNGKLHGHQDAFAASAGGRFVTLGVETVVPFLCRGLLADIPASKQLSRLAPSQGITAADLEESLNGYLIEPGDVVLVRTGWPQLYHDPVAYLGHSTGVPGITEAAAAWLADKGVRAVGSDTTATDQILPGAGHRHLPAHCLLLVERGIHIIEVMNFEELAASEIREFLFVAVPLRIVGGTGSPVRPLAIAFPN